MNVTISLLATWAPCVSERTLDGCRTACTALPWCEAYTLWGSECVIAGTRGSSAACGTALPSVPTQSDWRFKETLTVNGCNHGVCHINDVDGLPLGDADGESLRIVMNVSGYTGVIVDRTKYFEISGVANGLIYASDCSVNLPGMNTTVILRSDTRNASIVANTVVARGHPRKAPIDVRLRVKVSLVRE